MSDRTDLSGRQDPADPHGAPAQPPPGPASAPDPYAALERLAGEGTAEVGAGGLTLHVHIESGALGDRPAPEAVAALLPRLRTVLDGLPAIRERATEYLWRWGATDDSTEEEREAFLRDLVPTSLVVADGEGLQLHYEDVDERYVMDGYWPAVHLDRELNPVKVTIEA
jgi:hypothetical protein